MWTTCGRLVRQHALRCQIGASGSTQRNLAGPIINPPWRESTSRHFTQPAEVQATWPKPLSRLAQLVDTGVTTSAEQSSSTSPVRHRLVCFVRSVRKHGKVTFLDIDDGSIMVAGEEGMQALLRGDLKAHFDPQMVPGLGLELIVTVRQGRGKVQKVEFQIEDLRITGEAHADTYPLALEQARQTGKADRSSSSAISERMRRHAHLQPRYSRHAAVLRQRDQIDFAMSDYLRQEGFVRVVAPLLTASDCEGGGEVFRVEAASHWPKASQAKVEASSSTATSFWSDTQAFLTVSSQLHLEAMTMGLGRVFTVAPCFRAEGSATNRHLAEFWMCEAEQLTASDDRVALEEVMDTVEGVLRACIRQCVAPSTPVQALLWNGNEDGRAQVVALTRKAARWPRITYREALERLAGSEAPDQVAVPQWGQSLSSHQERWLARNGPIFVTDYPAEQKPFYMHLNDDNQTVACFDLLIPRIGELVGGSLREIRAEVMQRRMAETVNGETSAATDAKLQWYTDDLRRYGSMPHGGFGIGIERLLIWLTDTENIRDVITFPRTRGPLHF